MAKKKAKPEVESAGDLFGKLLANLPPIVRELLPFDTGAAPEKEKEIASPTKKSGTSWQDVCFVHSTPGEDDDEGLLVLGDGSMRKYINCKGINALLFDDAEREQFARDFASLANSLEADIQIMAISKHLNVDEYLKNYQTAVRTDNEYLRWYADFSDKWFRRSQDLHFVAQRDFYVIVSYQPPDCRNVSRGWSGKRSVQKHEEYQEELNQYCKSVFEQLRASSLRPSMLTRREMRELIYAHLNPAQSQVDPEAPPSRPGVSESAVLARSRLKVSDNYLLFDGKYVGTQYMQQVPPEALMGWLVAMLDLNVEYTSSLFIHCCDQDQAPKKNNKISGAMPRIGGEPPRTAKSAIKEFLKTSNKVFDMSFYIKTHADSLDRLAANMDEIRRIFRQQEAN
ncbi:MAG: conjugal transfer protein TraC, partial [Candidatus Obscuribacterales bacterium]|nr:conjugal transfer protein TraC [Candidatus Obscuribacterales bacterium]